MKIRQTFFYVQMSLFWSLRLYCNDLHSFSTKIGLTSELSCRPTDLFDYGHSLSESDDFLAGAVVVFICV